MTASTLLLGVVAVLALPAAAESMMVMALSVSREVTVGQVYAPPVSLHIWYECLLLRGLVHTIIVSYSLSNGRKLWRRRRKVR